MMLFDNQHAELLVTNQFADFSRVGPAASQVALSTPMVIKAHILIMTNLTSMPGPAPVLSAWAFAPLSDTANQYTCAQLLGLPPEVSFSPRQCASKLGNPPGHPAQHRPLPIPPLSYVFSVPGAMHLCQ